MKTEINIRVLSPKSFDIALPRKAVDTHLRWEKQTRQWTLTAFDSQIEDADKAYITTFELGTGNEQTPPWNEVFETFKLIKSRVKKNKH